MNEKSTVLLAEDEEGFWKPIKDYLSDRGYEILLAEDVEGLKSQVSAADILIVDARLPINYSECIEDLNGIIAVAELIKANKIKPDVPIIFVSILTESECQATLRQTNIHDRYCWLQKPIEGELLEIRINEQSKKLSALV